MRNILLSFLFICLSHISFAQTPEYNESDFVRKPVWISMIKDTSVNFFEAEKAFNIYFQHHEKPGGEEDVIGDHAARTKNPSKKEQRKIQADNHMRMDIKRYERWHDKMLPFVQADGTILTPSQRLKIWADNKNK